MKDIELYPQQQTLIPNIATLPSFKLLVHSIMTLGVCSGFTIPASADITTGGDGTVVNQSGNTFNITGGTPSGNNGNNLFHSFGTFNLTTTQTSTQTIPQVANFQPGANIQNIFGRINSGLPSSINGTIQVNGGTSPNVVNLYLMNPAGIVFGKNASLNINGAFTATTAKAIDFGNGNWFNALGANTYTELKGNPIGLAFPGSTPGSIFSAATFDASPLDPSNPARIRQTAKPGQSITLVGGTVISTGDIKTAGGNISITTVEAGKYVEIKAEGNILGMAIPISTNNINGEAKPLTALSLPELLTATKPDLVATGVKNENGVVTLVGDPKAIDRAIAAGDTVSRQNRPISSGDVITKNLDTSAKDVNGGNIYIESNQAIFTADINTYSRARGIETSGGALALNSQTEIKTGIINTRTSSDLTVVKVIAKGGNVNLSTQTKDIIVDSINTGANFNTSNDELRNRLARGGNITVNATGLFRVITPGEFLRSIDASPFGIININHGGTAFVTGGDEKSVADNVIFSSSGEAKRLKLTEGFKFGTGESGALGFIVTSVLTNGATAIVFTNSRGFYDFTRKLDGSNGSSITANPKPDPKPDPNPNPDPNPKPDPNPNPDPNSDPNPNPNKTGPKNDPDNQAAKQKSKQDCTPSSTAVATNSTTDPNRAEGNTSAPLTSPCQLVIGTTGGTLQILNNKN